MANKIELGLPAMAGATQTRLTEAQRHGFRAAWVYGSLSSTELPFALDAKGHRLPA
jgi:hypothetical protein